MCIYSWSEGCSQACGGKHTRIVLGCQAQPRRAELGQEEKELRVPSAPPIPGRPDEAWRVTVPTLPPMPRGFNRLLCRIGRNGGL